MDCFCKLVQTFFNLHFQELTSINTDEGFSEHSVIETTSSEARPNTKRQSINTQLIDTFRFVFVSNFICFLLFLYNISEYFEVELDFDMNSRNEIID